MLALGQAFALGTIHVLSWMNRQRITEVFLSSKGRTRRSAAYILNTCKELGSWVITMSLRSIWLVDWNLHVIINSCCVFSCCISFLFIKSWCLFWYQKLMLTENVLLLDCLVALVVSTCFFSPKVTSGERRFGCLLRRSIGGDYIWLMGLTHSWLDGH